MLMNKFGGTQQPHGEPPCQLWEEVCHAPNNATFFLVLIAKRVNVISLFSGNTSMAFHGVEEVISNARIAEAVLTLKMKLIIQKSHSKVSHALSTKENMD